MKKAVHVFQKTVWDYYRLHGRDLPWRHPASNGSFDAYKMLVSELMLQQTQVVRVIPKYQQFLDVFPDVSTLAAASLGEVLKVWSGLGYNRRAKYLHDAAKQLTTKPQPWTYEDLVTCKGVGPNTAAATCVYAYNQPRIFIETNIRSAFIHHFFADRTAVSDTELVPYIGQALDPQRPREWYWALMDYGSHLKTTEGNAARRSKHYSRQSAFEGSLRQLRGEILRLLAAGPLSLDQLAAQTGDQRTRQALDGLVKDGLLRVQNQRYATA